MIDKTVSTLPNHVCITFELPASVWADHIFVVGDFNEWCATATPMHQDHDGIWRARVDLPWGARSEFRYLIDGQWTSDFHADGFAPNLGGTTNSVICALLPDEMLTLGRTYSQIWDSPPSGKISTRCTGLSTCFSGESKSVCEHHRSRV